MLRKSKSTIQKAMDDLDMLLEESACTSTCNSGKTDQGLEGLDSVERFYRSNDFIGGSMNIRSLKEYVPRTDISRICYGVEEKEKEVRRPTNFGYSIGDRQILKNELYRKHSARKIIDPACKLKPKSALIITRLD